MRATPILAALVVTACASEAEPNAANGNTDAPPQASCTVEQGPRPLPDALTESSGLAASRRTGGFLWTHNDSGSEPVVYAVSPTGEAMGTVRVEGARNRDWEDIATGPCPSGSCLFIGDVGDNQGTRENPVVYRLPEPDPRGGASDPAEELPVRFPSGAEDSEAIFVLPGGELYLVTKGRTGPVELYRYPPPLRPGEPVTLERVASFRSADPNEVLQVTAASASPNGEWVAIRAYRSLMLYRTPDLLKGDATPALTVDLTAVGEMQGEGVALYDDGTVLLTSEGERRAPGTISRLRCELP